MMNDINLLKKLYKINSSSGNEEEIRNFISSYIRSIYKNVLLETDSTGNLYITKGNIKPYFCIVAHMDQVSKYKGKISIYRKENFIIGVGNDNKQVNLGADDKNGIWVALEMLKVEENIKIAFFVSEEIGCVGSSYCNIDFFKDVKYVIQCDRKGGKDFINETYSTQLCPDNFIDDNLKKKYGYSNAIGMMTDVETLKERGINVACCNISCGYYNPHTNEEFTNLTELINCLNFVKEIAKTVPLTKHTYEEKRFYRTLDYEPTYYTNYNYPKQYNEYGHIPYYDPDFRYYDWDLDFY